MNDISYISSAVKCPTVFQWSWSALWISPVHFLSFVTYMSLGMYQNINWSPGLYQTQTRQMILFSPTANSRELWRGSVLGFGSHWLTALIIIRSQWLVREIHTTSMTSMLNSTSWQQLTGTTHGQDIFLCQLWTEEVLISKIRELPKIVQSRKLPKRNTDPNIIYHNRTLVNISLYITRCRKMSVYPKVERHWFTLLSNHSKESLRSSGCIEHKVMMLQFIQILVSSPN